MPVGPLKILRNLSPKWRRLFAIGVGAILCTVAPLLANRFLTRKVQGELAQAASDIGGVAIQLGDAAVGVTGTLKISDIRFGDLWSAASVTANLAPSHKSPLGLTVGEIVVNSPHFTLTWGEHTADIRAFRKRFNHSAPPLRAASKLPHLPRPTIRFVDGSMHVNLGTRSHIQSSGIDIQVHQQRVHVVFGATHISWHHNGYQLQTTIPNAALDYKLGDSEPTRVLAYGGTAQMSGPGGSVRASDLWVSKGINGSADWKLNARTGVDRISGAIALIATKTSAGSRWTAEAKELPLAFAGPWLPPAFTPDKSRISGNLSITHAGDTRADVHLSANHLHVSHPSLAPDPLQFDLDVDASARLYPSDDGHSLDAHLQRLQSKDLVVTGHASGRWLGKFTSSIPDLGQLALRVNAIECGSALASLPVALRPVLAGLELRGTLQSKLDITMSRTSRAGTSVAVSSGVDQCSVVREPPAADTTSLVGVFEHTNNRGQTKVLVNGSPHFTSLRKLPGYVANAFVVAEDAGFYSHRGFDRHQIENALATDLESGRVVRGGSTISQQLIKNLFLSHKRTLARKLQEAILTWRLESNVRKKRILELYLNIIELGDNDTFGITMAARYWFDTQPAKLTVLQTAFLAALTPEPHSMSARIRAASGLDPTSRERVNLILRAMKRGAVIDTEQFRHAINQQLTFATHAIPSH